jgi:beta-lactam-binding protein with PASTA domain
MGKILLSIISILAITVGLVFSSYAILNIYTKHGKNQKVPDVKGKSFYDAKKLLSNSDLDYLVVDSTYRDGIPPLSIIDQQPRKGAYVKDGRKVYLTLNASQPPSVKIPNLIDNSTKTGRINIK